MQYNHLRIAAIIITYISVSHLYVLYQAKLFVEETIFPEKDCFVVSSCGSKGKGAGGF
jgi:hypothetical protein